MAELTGTAGTLETREDAGDGNAGLVSLWLDAIALADKEEKTWRERADLVERIYRGDDKADVSMDATAKRKYNILYSNTETLAPAIYNTPPIPDVRRRFRDPDPIGKVGAQILERCLSYSIDDYDFSARMDASVKDTLLPGRGVLRVRYEPEVAEDDTIRGEKVTCETVDWRRFRRGPGRFWPDVPWVAFELFLTREEFKRLSPRIGATVNLDCSVSNDRQRGDASPEPEMLKRGRVWEIWDREQRKVLFIAPAYKEGPVAQFDDPLGLKDFFPVPRPLYGLETPGNLVPIPPYRAYQGLAEDLEVTSRRIAALVAALRWKGAYADPAIGDFLSKFEDAEDGAILPVDNPAAVLQGGGLDKAFWFLPIDVLVNVLVQLYAARQEIKQAIYEVTGISDIVRGASVASETATAQQIKAQWGSLRIQKLQREVQRFARDVLRMKGEIIAKRFQPQTIFAMSGVNLPTQMQLQMAQQQGQEVPPNTVTQEQVIEFLRNDVLRDYRIDIETDSTIRADLTGEQQNITQFVQGFGTFIQAVGPAVQAGFVPMKDAATLLKSFTRSFKLGRDAEDAIESLGEHEPPQQGDPNAQAQAQAQATQQAAEMQAQVEREAAERKAQTDMQVAQMKAQADLQAEEMRQAAETERERMRLSAEMERHRDTLAAEVEKARIAAQSQESIKANEVASRPPEAMN